MGHGILYETLEKADTPVDTEVLLQVFGRLSSMLQTKQQLGTVSVFLHPVQLNYTQQGNNQREKGGQQLWPLANEAESSQALVGQTKSPVKPRG